MYICDVKYSPYILTLDDHGMGLWSGTVWILEFHNLDEQKCHWKEADV